MQLAAARSRVFPVPSQCNHIDARFRSVSLLSNPDPTYAILSYPYPCTVRAVELGPAAELGPRPTLVAKKRPVQLMHHVRKSKFAPIVEQNLTEKIVDFYLILCFAFERIIRCYQVPYICLYL